MKEYFREETKGDDNEDELKELKTDHCRMEQRLKPIDELTDEEIRIEFEQILREKMTNDEFWNWVRSWKDPNTIIKEVLDSNLGDMEDLIKDFRKGAFL